MRVGIDAGLLSEPVTGIGRYTAELSRELVQLEGCFHFYSPKPVTVSGWERERCCTRSSVFHNRIGKMLWSQTVLPFWAAQDKVDVFWGATHRLPRFLPASIARVVTIHDLVWKQAGDTMRPVSWWLEQHLMPEAIRLADRIMADSQSTADALESEFPLARGKVRIVYPGATSLGPPDTRASLSTLGIDRPYALFVGTLEPRKNLLRLLRTFASLPRDLRDRTLLVIAGGKGWGGVDVHGFAAEYGIEGDVRLVGYVSDAQLATLYAHAQFLAMPSLCEGFGLPLVEAMSYGTPVLTSSISSLPEVAGDAGILVNPLDEQAIQGALLILLQQESLRLTLSAKAREQAEKFTWKNAARQAMAVFSEALAERTAKQRSHH